MLTNKKITDEEVHNSLFSLPLIIIICIVPFIVYSYVFQSVLVKYPWFSVPDDTSTDFFLHYKSVLLMITLLFMIGIYIYQAIVKKQKLSLSLIFFPLAIYCLLAIGSSICSPYRSTSLHGMLDQFEPIGVVIAYCVMCHYAFSYLKTEKQIIFLLKCWVIALLALSLLGLTQILGHDLLATDLGKRLITPSSYWGNLDSLNFVFGKNRVYLTLYNPNYVGVLASLVIPIFAVFLLYAKKKIQIVTCIFVLIGMSISIVGSQSKTALISLCITLLFGMILLRHKLMKIWKQMLIALFVLLVLVIGFDTFTGHAYTKSILNALHEKTQPVALTDITTNKDNITITLDGEKLNVAYTRDSNNNFMFDLSDQTGTKISLTYDENNKTYSIDDKRFHALILQAVQFSDRFGFSVIYDEKSWYFSNEFDDHSYHIYNALGKWDKIVPSQSAELFDNASFSGRGYLWNYTIPLLRSCILLGSGQDTFALVFPQQNYVSAYNNGYEGAIVTKPHNMYLQMGVQTGVLSLICFLIFYGIYFITSLKYYWKRNNDDFYNIVGIAIFLGTIGYMISGIVNDSTVTVAPMYWVLLGTGISVNEMVKKNAIGNK